MTIRTVSDLFEETDDWLNDEEALALEKIDELKNEYKENTGKWPTIIYVGDNEELQSYMLWFAPYYGLKSARTEGDTFVCGHLGN